LRSVTNIFGVRDGSRAFSRILPPLGAALALPFCVWIKEDVLQTIFNRVLMVLAMASVVLAPHRAFAASSKGCVGGGFSLLGLSGDQKAIVQASQVGATFLVKGKYVEFTTPVATNSIVFRYSIPDTGSGSVYTAPLSMYVDGAKQTWPINTMLAEPREQALPLGSFDGTASPSR